MPDELPPSYEESLDRPGGSTTTRPVIPNRPPPAQNHLQVPQQPPRPSSSNSSNYGAGNSSNTSFNAGNVSNSSIGSGKSGASGKSGRGHSPGPPGPHGRPPHSPGPHGRPPPGPPHSPNHPPRQMGYGPRPQGGPAPNNPLLHYPRGYHCPKCDNTGIKKKNGKSCQDCWGMFARPNQQVINVQGPQQQYNPFPFFPFSPPPPTQQTRIIAAPGAPPPVVVQPGDPRLGGQLCGKCRGRGLVYDWFSGDETCYVCKGVGRVR
ncbi:hypothetical protein CJU90_3881 [Yarrowia sp. C11]|nr:hypothetical protein CKK34_5492 [Yarrowia sp. E02]KAG5367581.1 hypothetical protein CJU90_3881 [Yarrowia sp. C11]